MYFSDFSFSVVVEDDLFHYYNYLSILKNRLLQIRQVHIPQYSHTEINNAIALLNNLLISTTEDTIEATKQHRIIAFKKWYEKKFISISIGEEAIATAKYGQYHNHFKNRLLRLYSNEWLKGYYCFEISINHTIKQIVREQKNINHYLQNRK